MAAVKKKPYGIQPRQKLRRINWQKVNERVLKGTFWEDLNEESHALHIDWEYVTVWYRKAVCIKQLTLL
jgi:transposase-like protein